MYQNSFIVRGKSENLLVNCSLNVASTPELAFLNSLILSRSVDMNKSDYQVVASISRIGGRVYAYDGDGVGSVVISNKGESYLSVQWAYPVYDIAGTYVCEANGMSFSWKPQILSSSTKISSSQLLQNSVGQLLRSSKMENIQRIEEIKQLSEKNKILEKKVTDFINDSKEKQKITIKTLFYEFSLYNGHRYYLIRESVLVLPTLAQAMCAKYGGYLAEIDDEKELFFARTFLRKYPIFRGVLISGTDEGHEGYWTNFRNNAALKYSKFYHSEPSGGKSENCMVLWRDFDWFIGDYPCLAFNLDKICGYLCEDFRL